MSEGTTKQHPVKFGDVENQALLDELDLMLSILLRQQEEGIGAIDRLSIKMEQARV